VVADSLSAAVDLVLAISDPARPSGPRAAR
jgi:hypothetical protein